MRRFTVVAALLLLVQGGVCSLVGFGLGPEPDRPGALFSEAAGGAPPPCHGGAAAGPTAPLAPAGDSQCQDHCRLFGEVCPAAAPDLALARPVLALAPGLATQAGVRCVLPPSRSEAAPPARPPLPILNCSFLI